MSFAILRGLDNHPIGTICVLSVPETGEAVVSFAYPCHKDNFARQIGASISEGRARKIRDARESFQVFPWHTTTFDSIEAAWDFVSFFRDEIAGSYSRRILVSAKCTHYLKEDFMEAVRDFANRSNVSVPVNA